MELPVLGEEPRERADAARNRVRILEAAKTLFARDGVRCTSMDAIAGEAGVGKGTLFRRFGDRAALALAVLEETERTLQDGFLSGPPPLGPGAAARDRIVAFGNAMLDRVETHGDLMLEAETGGAFLRSRPHAVHWLHLRTLLEDARPDVDSQYAADLLLAALAAEVVVHQRRVRGLALDRLKAGFADLTDRLIDA